MVSALLVRRNSSAAIGFAVDLQREFFVQTIAVRQSPDPAAGAARRHLGIAVAAGVEEILRPHVNAAGVDVAAMIQIDRGEGISLSQHVGDAVGVAGLHRRQRGGVVAQVPGSLVLACRVRLRRHEWRFLPAAVGPVASSARPPIAAARSAAPRRCGNFG